METNTGRANAADAETLTTAQCWDHLRRGVVGRLAVVHGGRPDIFPVNFAVDHGTVVFRTGSGSLFASSAGQAVAFEVDGYAVADANAWSVVIRGAAREIVHVDEALEAMRLPLYPWHEGPKPRFVRIEPDSISGREFQVRGGHMEPGREA